MLKKRAILDTTRVAQILRARLGHAFSANIVIRLSDPQLACVSRKEIQAAADKVYTVWKEHVNDCDKQAMHVVNECHLRAAKESTPWAVGFLRANMLFGAQVRATPRVDHVYCWFFESPDSLVIFDQTARVWTTADRLSEVDFIYN